VQRCNRILHAAGGDEFVLLCDPCLGAVVLERPGIGLGGVDADQFEWLPPVTRGAGGEPGVAQPPAQVVAGHAITIRAG